MKTIIATIKDCCNLNRALNLWKYLCEKYDAKRNITTWIPKRYPKKISKMKPESMVQKKPIFLGVATFQ